MDALPLELYVRAVGNARACRLEAEKRPIVQGKDGPRAHPGLNAAAQAEERALALAEALLLSPAARERATKPGRRAARLEVV